MSLQLSSRVSFDTDKPLIWWNCNQCSIAQSSLLPCVAALEPRLLVAHNVMHRFSRLCRNTALWSYQHQYATIKELCLWTAVAFILDNRTPTAHETGCVHLVAHVFHACEELNASSAAQYCLFQCNAVSPRLTPSVWAFWSACLIRGDTDNPWFVTAISFSHLLMDSYLMIKVY